MMRHALLAAALLPLLAGGCLARAAVDVVTLPVKATAKAVDWSTTSQAEADRNAGRKMRKAEEREARDRRKWEQECRKRERDDCARYDGYQAER